MISPFQLELVCGGQRAHDGFRILGGDGQIITVDRNVRYLGRWKRRYLNKGEFLRVGVASAINTEEESTNTQKAIRAKRAQNLEN